jgi:hypothetical protein
MSVNIQNKPANTTSKLATILLPQKMEGIDTRAKLVKIQQSKIRDYYSRIFKNENKSLEKQDIAIKSSISSSSKTRKKIGFKIPTKTITLKATKVMDINYSN